MYDWCLIAFLKNRIVSSSFPSLNGPAVNEPCATYSILICIWIELFGTSVTISFWKRLREKRGNEEKV